GLADDLGGLAPARSERQGDVVVVDPGQSRDVVGGLGCDVERVRIRVVEGVRESVWHETTLGMCGPLCQYGRMERMSQTSFANRQSVAVPGGGPGGYEAALAAAQLGAEVTLVERVGVGGSAVLTDVVPSKSLIATADAAVAIAEASDLGVQFYAKGENGKP